MSLIQHVRPYLRNSGWIALEHIVKICTSIITLGMIANHYSTTEFGMLNYGLAIVSILTPIARLGLDSVLVVEVSQHISNFRKYLANAWWMVLLSASLLTLTTILITTIISEDTLTRHVVIVSAFSLILLSFLVFDSYFQAIIQYRLSSVSKILSLLVGVLIKIYLIKNDANLIWICASFIFDNLLLGLTLFILYVWRTKDIQLLKPSQIDFEIIKSLFNQSWPMIISGLTGILLSKLDQLMIQNYMGASNLGIYAACSRVYEGWISLTFMYSIAALPLLIKINKQKAEESLPLLSLLFAIPLVASILFSIMLTLSAKPLLQFVFGKPYIAGEYSLILLGICSIFASLGYMSNRFLIVAGKQKVIAHRNVLAIVMNAAFNAVLIPIYGIIGAPLATLITLIFTNIILDYLNPELATLKHIKQRIFLLKF